MRNRKKVDSVRKGSRTQFFPKVSTFKIIRKGEKGESIVKKDLSELDPFDYRVFNGINIPNSEIDHLVVSKFGIFVLETKNLNGEVSGTDDSKFWFQVYGNGKHTKISNPIVQNQWHIEKLAKFLHLDESKFHSVICLVGKAKIKTKSKCVKRKNWRQYIESFTDLICDDYTVQKAIEKLSNL